MDTFFLTMFLAVMAYMTCWYIASLVKKNMSIVDIAWGLGFVLIAWLSHALAPSKTLLVGFIAVLITIWGLRLALHIGKRNHGKGEDPRYQKWRKDWGNTILWRSFLQVFVLQGIMMFVVASPVILLAAMRGNPNALLVDPSRASLIMVGFFLWVMGFLFEVIGDRQLKKFIANPANKGRLMMKGLWSITRHPNYFGEASMWWGIWLMTFAMTGAWWTVASPVLITYLLRFVSGVTMTERRWAQKPDFPAYKARVNAFIPWFPKTK